MWDRWGLLCQVRGPQVHRGPLAKWIGLIIICAVLIIVRPTEVHLCKCMSNSHGYCNIAYLLAVVQCDVTSIYCKDSTNHCSS
jgi:hypothetical protein